MECHFSKWDSVECLSAECHSSKYHSADCIFAQFHSSKGNFLSVVLLVVILLGNVLLHVHVTLMTVIPLGRISFLWVGFY